MIRKETRLVNLNSLNKREHEYVLAKCKEVSRPKYLLSVCSAIIDDHKVCHDFRAKLLVKLMDCPTSRPV